MDIRTVTVPKEEFMDFRKSCIDVFVFSTGQVGVTLKSGEKVLLKIEEEEVPLKTEEKRAPLTKNQRRNMKNKMRKKKKRLKNKE